MNNPCIAVILAVSSFFFSEDLIVKETVGYQHRAIAQTRTSEYKPEKKNCDLCVIPPRKRKTIQV
jgi:hypothetical protein